MAKKKETKAPSPAPKAKDFTIEKDSMNSFSLTIRCTEFSITAEDDLTEEDVRLFQRIEDLLNEHASRVIYGRVRARRGS